MRKLMPMVLVLFLVPTLVFAQGSIIGKVSGKSGALEGASVIATSGLATTTDASGNFNLKVPAGNYNLAVSYAGYKTFTQKVTVANGETVTVNVSLEEDNRLLEDVVVGARSLPRSAINSPLPVDVLSATDLRSTAQPTFDKQLQYKVPSFNTINTPVNDATTLLDPYEIRNLGPSRTLILINGKRKNLSSLLYVQFAPGRGETGADLSAIPIDAIKRVEILRDGASAQYGTDAMAGVMNVILKDRYQYSSLTVNAGITHKGDGENYGISFNSGSNIGSRGYLNYTIDFSQMESAVRSGIIHRPTEKAIFGGSAAADAAIDAFLNVYPTANNINGTGATSAAKFTANFGLPTSETDMFYGNMAYISKRVLSYANYRPPYWKLDNGLLHTRIPGAPNYTGGAGSLYDGYIGYVPTFEGDLTDYNGTFGFRSERMGWKHDVSITFGGNQQTYTVENTVNHSLGTASPTRFKPGGYYFGHVVGNYDISKSITDDFSIAFGAEARKETYKIIGGDTASYSGGGANSFPGIRQENASTNQRFNLGMYVDATYTPSKEFLINAAIRTEKFSDFGSAFVWKLSSRYKLNGDKAVLRASASTGFRAPSLHQIYAQSTQASFVGGFVQLSGLFNNRSKQAFALGIPLLKPEKSNNFTLGLGLNPNKNLNITLDYYGITINDRIVYSSSISSSNPSSTLGQILAAAGVVNIQFFINGIKTRTQGLDFVVNQSNIAWGKGKLGINFAGNYQLSNKIIGTPNDPPAIKSENATILSTQIKSLLTESRPQYKMILGFDYAVNKWSFNFNNTLFGPTRFQDLDNGGSDMENIRQEFSPAIVSDLNIGYKINDKINFNFAINNMFNKLPKWKLVALNPAGQSVLNNTANRELLEGFLTFSGRYRILGYNGSQFSQLGTIFQSSIVFRF